MSKITMPEPEAFLYVNGEHRGVSLNLRGDMDLSDGTVRHGLTTIDQAEAYANAKVREALEEAAQLCETYWQRFREEDLRRGMHNLHGGIYAREIRTRLPKESS